MRRSINDQLGYADRFNKNENIMSYNQYPAQGEVVGKYIAINFLDYSNQLFNYRVRFHLRHHPRNKSLTLSCLFLARQRNR